MRNYIDVVLLHHSPEGEQLALDGKKFINLIGMESIALKVDVVTYFHELAVD